MMPHTPVLGNLSPLIPAGKTALAQDAHLSHEGTGFGGIALAYNVRQREEVDAVLAEAQAAGATLLNLLRKTDWGGRCGLFR